MLCGRVLVLGPRGLDGMLAVARWPFETGQSHAGRQRVKYEDILVEVTHACDKWISKVGALKVSCPTTMTAAPSGITLDLKMPVLITCPEEQSSA